jgi:HD-like signal output (HDOD) protein
MALSQRRHSTTPTFAVLTSGERHAVPPAIVDLPPFPPVAQKLLLLIENPKVGLKEVGEIIRLDAAMTSNLLRLANSAMFGCRAEVATPLQALALLGIGKVRDLIITTAMTVYMGSPMNELSRTVMKRCWRHNLATALVSGEVANAAGLNRHTAYLGGLLHEVGRLALLRAFPGRYPSVLEKGTADDVSLWQTEAVLLGMSHREAGNWLAEQWQFPADLRQLFRELALAAAEDAEPSQPGHPSLCSLVEIGSALAGALGFPALGAEQPEDRESLLAKLPAGARQELGRKHASFWADIATRIRVIESSLALWE